MGKTLIFEGVESKCPVCSKHSLGELGQLPMHTTQKDLVMSMLQGGAIGAGTATVMDMLIPKLPIVNTLPATVTPFVNAGICTGIALYMYKRNPSLAVGIGIGGVAVAGYKLISALMGKVISTSGLGRVYARPMLSPSAEAPISIESAGTGVIVPVEHSMFGEEILVD